MEAKGFKIHGIIFDLGNPRLLKQLHFYDLDHFCFDNPAPLKSRLTASPFNFTPTQFNALYSIYSLPNMILPLVGGIAMDKLGVR